MNARANQFMYAEAYLTQNQMSVCCNLRLDQIKDLVDNDVIVPDGPKANLYSKAQVARLRTACQLQGSFELEASAIWLALAHLERIELLEKRVTQLQFALLDELCSTLH